MTCVPRPAHSSERYCQSVCMLQVCDHKITYNSVMKRGAVTSHDDCRWHGGCCFAGQPSLSCGQAMTKDGLKRRRRFALDVIRLGDSLPRSRATEVIGRQLLRAATSVGANYRAACRARSSADFVSKMGTVEEEADESMYWMELHCLSRASRCSPAEFTPDRVDHLSVRNTKRRTVVVQ